MLIIHKVNTYYFDYRIYIYRCICPYIGIKIMVFGLTWMYYYKDQVERLSTNLCVDI